MRTHARQSRGDRTKATLEEEHERRGVDDLYELLTADDADEGFDEESSDIFRVHCPDCGRPIALTADEEVLPQHAVCPTPWNPFGLTVCPGSGRAALEAVPADGPVRADELELGTVLTLPAGLDWRTQPFSHVGGPSSRPFHTPVRRQHAA
jgi:hypothetical protein